MEYEVKDIDKTFPTPPEANYYDSHLHIIIRKDKRKFF